MPLRRAHLIEDGPHEADPIHGLLAVLRDVEKAAPIASGRRSAAPLVNTTMPRSSPGMNVMKVAVPSSKAPEWPMRARPSSS
ncbi:MAG: hypothetical protein R3D01_00280 [Hyphomicrobiales bacterium]